MRKFTIIIILLYAISFFIPVKVSAQVLSIENEITHIFGDSIYFSAEIVSDMPIRAAVLLFQAEGDSKMNVHLAEVDNLANNTYQVSFLHQLSDYPIRSFSNIQYHWEFTMAPGEILESPVEEFLYDDNRFEWEVQERGKFRVHWFEGDQQFAQDIISIAENGVNKINGIIAVPDPGIVDIYIYPDAETMQDALLSESKDWVAAHADPELGVILAALPESPEQWLLAEQRIPHELMHILMYRETGIRYKNLPIWLKEGLASAAELYPNSDFRIILDSAARNGALLPIESLCTTFPSDASNARLAYAESLSFIQHLQNTVGASGLQAMLTAYSNGLDCESGVQQALGMSLKQAERSWQRETLPANERWIELLTLSPWISLLFLALGASIIITFNKIREASMQKNPG